MTDLFHITILLRVIHLDKDKVLAMDPADGDPMKKHDVVSQDFYRKVKILILECEKRGWLIE